jgi:vacuolar-type H+-ATPase subunit D/Vma8
MDDQNECETSINSRTNIEISKRDLIRLRDRIDYLDVSMQSLEKEQMALKMRISELIRDIEVLRASFDSSFSEYIQDLGAEDTRIEQEEDTFRAKKGASYITLGMSEITREKILTTMDVIKRACEESQGSASKDLILSRVKEIGISGDDFEDILSRLRRAGALKESDGELILI